MNGIMGKLLAGGIVAVLALGAIAFAAAESGSSGGNNAQGHVSLEATPTETPEPTEAAETPEAENEDKGDQEDESDSEVARTSALNPAGHCVDLPDDSNVISEPDKHDNWTITDCQPANEDEHEENTSEGDEEEEHESEKIPGTNPGDECTSVSENSDVAQNPDDHPGWSLGDCED